MKPFGSLPSRLRSSALYFPTMGSSGAVLAYEWGETTLRRGLFGRIVRLAGRLRMRLARNP